jgi:outer membrane protein OmpA-like peptidoglycan-associated protein
MQTKSLLLRASLIGPILIGLCATMAASSDELKPVDPKSIKIRDLVFHVEDIGGKVDELAGGSKGLQDKVDSLAGGAKGLLATVKDLAVKETKTEIRIELAADVLFDFDKSNLLPKAQKTLHQAATIIKDNAKGSVRIEGYTDAKGSDSYNQKLSERRANSVKTWFVTKEGLKVPFTTQGFGAKNPVASNKKPDGSDDPIGRQKNRRVEIIIQKS